MGALLTRETLSQRHVCAGWDGHELAAFASHHRLNSETPDQSAHTTPALGGRTGKP
jgi:hypothetical protein